jgi:DnaK suppressor protein
VDHLDQEQLAELTERLRSERTRLEQSLERREAQMGGEDPGDAQDAAAEHASRTQESQLLRREQDRLSEVLAALGRMDAGSYGICLDSDEPIPLGRLRLDPAVRYTVDAQESLEAEGRLTTPAGDEAY